MTAMSLDTREPLLPPHREWTVADLAGLPDDGLRYELLDGLLLVSPAPIPIHQRVIRKLGRMLDDGCPPELELYYSPVDWQPDDRTSLQPDLLVVPVAGVGPTNITAPLALAVEVLSPSTRGKDLLLKRQKYETAGVAGYWVIDPIVPSVLILERRGAGFETAAEIKGDDLVEVGAPFTLAFRPADLITR